jgi:hypothetical protein
LIINPGVQAGRGHAQANSIPLAVLKSHVPGRVILRGILAIDTRNTDYGTTPTSDNQTAVGLLDGKRESTEKVVSIDLDRLQFQLIVQLREPFLISDPGERISERHLDATVRDGHFTFTTKTSRLPTRQRAAVKQGAPSGRYFFV